MKDTSQSGTMKLFKHRYTSQKFLEDIAEKERPDSYSLWLNWTENLHYHYLPLHSSRSVPTREISPSENVPVGAFQYKKRYSTGSVMMQKQEAERSKVACTVRCPSVPLSVGA